MSTISDGLSSVNALTTQINALKEQSTSSTTTPTADEALLSIEQNFNSMLNDLIYTSKNDDDDDDSNSAIFDYLNTYNKSTTAASTDATGQTSTTDNSVLQYSLQVAQNNLNLNDIF